ncbi:MAG: septum formation protein Maf [Zetaproteobacteria bacterium CG2_30_46_52]|nr:MAG: septum formation protein Maf [Zetaproteobacteria bacterium CG2_30_46_52]
MNIILASQSPRRLELLQNAGLSVLVRPSHIDESPLPGESATAMTLRLCQEKAKACVLAASEKGLVIAADTLVEVDGQALGQPEDLQQAKAMIRLLSGKEHHVHTAVCVSDGEITKVKMETTSVQFRDVSESEIETYVQHNDIIDKAGAYAIQGGASSFIIGIQGKLDNVIGLPVATTLELIEQVKQSKIVQANMATCGV